MENELQKHRFIGNMDKKSVADYLWYCEFKLLLKNEWIESYDDYKEINSFVEQFFCDNDEDEEYVEDEKEIESEEKEEEEKDENNEDQKKDL